MLHQELPNEAKIPGDHDRTAGRIPDLSTSSLEWNSIDCKIGVVIRHQHRVEHGDVEVLPAAGPVSQMKGREDRHESVQAGVHVGDGEDGIAGGSIIEFGLARHDAGFGVKDSGVGGAMRLGSVLTEAGNRKHDETGIVRGEFLPRESVSSHDVGPKILDDDVGPRRKPLDEFSRSRRLEVDANALFARVLLSVVAG